MVEPQSRITGGGLIVTGSSRGIGAEICRLAAQRGWSVCVNYRNSHDEAVAVVDQIRTSGGVAVAVQADVPVEAEVSTMFDQGGQGFGPGKGLGNNGGVNGGG
ncbi:MAG TPA: SDR family NAD(P)-dependent oxidoreductase, partial [Arenicellales bacterium]|nr:SDR family NAD(P)-dependent oxidoreductase [Arenicellales bacterium]